MQRELLDALRCPGAHEEAWLVAVVHDADGTALYRADLACPVCEREFHIRDGVACFCAFPPTASPDRSGAGAAVAPDTVAPPSDAGLRLAAQLAVTDHTAPVLLVGDRARVGAVMQPFVPNTQLWVNAPADVTRVGGTGISMLCIERMPLPLGAATLAGAAMDVQHADEQWIAGVIRCVRQGGRIVVPATVQLPEDLRTLVRELARDDHDWVGEVLTPPSGLVTLRRQSVPA